MAVLERYGFEPTSESTAYLDWSNDHEVGTKPPFSWDELGKAEDTWLEKKIRETESSTQLKGSLIKFQIADGYAWYIVKKLRPLTLQQVIGYSFEYSLPEAWVRGLTKRDIEKQLDVDRALKLMYRKRSR